MKAIILDDDPLVRNLLVGVLREKGYEVDAFSSPAKCPLYTAASCPCSLKDSCPDLIVTDYNMPEVNGSEFIENLKRKQCQCQNIAVVSGGWLETDLSASLPAGVNVFSKPYAVKGIADWAGGIMEKAMERAHYPNRRTSVRYPCEFPVEVYVQSPGLLEMVSAVVRNISKGGMMVECSRLLESMTSCQLAFAAPDWFPLKEGTDCVISGNGREVMVLAEARYSNKSNGTCGFQFMESFASLA